MGRVRDAWLDGIKKLEFIEVCNEEATISFSFPLDIEDDEEMPVSQKFTQVNSVKGTMKTRTNLAILSYKI